MTLQTVVYDLGIGLLLAGAVATIAIRFGRRSIASWIDHPGQTKRWISRTLLLFAAFFVPFGIVMVAFNLLEKINGFSDVFFSMSWYTRTGAVASVIVVLWYFFYQASLRRFRSNAVR